MTLNLEEEKNYLEQWVDRDFRFYEQYIRENIRARKRETTQYNTAKLSKPSQKHGSAHVERHK